MWLSKTPMTSERISAICGLRYDQVWRRMSELERAGLVIDSGKTEKTSSGRNATLWELNELTLF
jgi:predicted ArsR family transcriptional regulator